MRLRLIPIQNRIIAIGAVIGIAMFRGRKKSAHQLLLEIDAVNFRDNTTGRNGWMIVISSAPLEGI
jgi:hypothetical protein